MSLKQYVSRLFPLVAITIILGAIVLVIFSVIFAPMAPDNWNVREDAFSRYSVDKNTFDKAIFPFEENGEVLFNIKSISAIKNLTTWWITSLELNSSPEISYNIHSGNNNWTTSTDYNFLLPVFYPGAINKTLLQEAGKSSKIISNFSITNVNSFVGELTIEYNINKLNRWLNVQIIFDVRYNGIAYSVISDKNNFNQLILTLNGTNNSSRPSDLVRMLFNLLVTIFISIMIFVVGFIMYSQYKRKKNKLD